MMLTHRHAILSGFCAASASIFGKFSGSSYLDNLFLARVLFFALMIVSNTFVWISLVKALQQAQSSLTTISISTATNYLTSGIFGYIVFGELTFTLWCLGTFFIIGGLMLIVSDDSTFKDDVLKKE